MEIPNDVVALVLTVLAGGGGAVGVHRWRNGSGRHAAAADGTERRKGQSELIAAVREQTVVTIQEGSKTRVAIHASAETTQRGITALAGGVNELAKEQAAAIGYLKAKL